MVGSPSRRLALGLALLGCGAPRAAPDPARAVDPVALTPTVAEPCRIEATRAELRADAPGVEPFAVVVTDGSLRLEPTDDPATLRARVAAPLAFDARAPTDRQRLALARPRSTDTVVATEGVPVIAFGRDESLLAGTVQLGRSLPGEGGVVLEVGPLALACADVASASGSTATTSTLARVTPSELAVARAVPVSLRPAPAHAAGVTIRPRGEPPALPLFVTERRGGWARATLAFTDGSRVEGWSPAAELRRPDGEESAWVERRIARSPRSMALGAAGALPSSPPAPQAGVRVGVATLAPGTPVFARADDVATGEPWARTPDHPLEVRARGRDGEPAQLLEVSGLSAPAARLWVRPAAVRWVPDAP